jgi:hypothetical protein
MLDRQASLTLLDQTSPRECAEIASCPKVDTPIDSLEGKSVCLPLQRRDETVSKTEPKTTSIDSNTSHYFSLQPEIIPKGMNRLEGRCAIEFE